MPFWFSMFFQESNSPTMEFLMFFHDLLIILMTMLIVAIMVIFILNMKMKIFNYEFPESQSLEDFWLIIPSIFLIFIGFPSIKNLYMFEEFLESDINIKVTGHQWYWSYEMDKMNNVFDCILDKESENFRLMETYNFLIVPIKNSLNFLISSEDVIHSWGVPSIGIKVDAMPGRISQVMALINRPGMILGECMEICGANHSFMPIIISCNSLKNFLK